MSLRDLLDTAQTISLAARLVPDEAAVWQRYCRSYSKKFSEPLSQVLQMDPLTVITAVFSDQLDDWEPEENMESLRDLLGHLSDADYDSKKEAAIREEMAQIEEREAERIREGRAVHSSMEKDKRVIVKDELPKKELPKSGGINMGLINKLNNQDREG
jgi:hypothetical protein